MVLLRLAVFLDVFPFDDDPITAMDLGTVARLSTSLYDDSGTVLEETRAYFDIPSSGAGSDGTNYDPIVYGYDDMGRRWRVKQPTGTINRTVFDALGRVTERWMGTNDSSFDGGESSGTDNMVKTEALEYDGNADDGNGYLTKRTRYVQDSDTDKRVTSYENDARGRMLLETPPAAPYPLHEYDNLGRRVATGLYSSTNNVTAGTTDPTSSATDRIGLTETFYDVMGRVWKTTRHKINASSGADDDDLETLHWYDKLGRRIKTDGRQLTKTFYDRLGRQTYRFVLAAALDSNDDPETAYDAADDLTYDVVP